MPFAHQRLSNRGGTRDDGGGVSVPLRPWVTRYAAGTGTWPPVWWRRAPCWRRFHPCCISSMALLWPLLWEVGDTPPHPASPITLLDRRAPLARDVPSAWNFILRTSCRCHTGKGHRMFQRPGTRCVSLSHPRHLAEFFSISIIDVGSNTEPETQDHLADLVHVWVGTTSRPSSRVYRVPLPLERNQQPRPGGGNSPMHPKRSQY